MASAASLVRVARHRSGLSQSELARRAGMSQPEVARLERPGANPTIATLEAVLGASGHRLALEPSDDVDLTQIVERLRLTPAERLASFQASQRNLQGLLRQVRRVDVPRPDLDPARLLRVLVDNHVDFVVVGGVAAVLYGSGRATFDLDVCCASDDANLDAMGTALVDLGARLRGVDEDVPFVPDAATLRRVEPLTLRTPAGDLDVLRRPVGVPRFDILRRRASRFDLGGFEVAVASLEDLITMKAAADRPKDRGDLVELQAILRLSDPGGEG